MRAKGWIGVAGVLVVMFGHPAPADAGILSWFFGLFGGGEARAVASTESRILAPMFGGAESRVVMSVPTRSVRAMERASARIPTSLAGAVKLPQRAPMSVRLGALTAPASGAPRQAQRILRNTRAGAVPMATKAEAGRLVPANRGKAQVTATSPSVQMKFDLNPTGKPHRGVPTPHVERRPLNAGAATARQSAGLPPLQSRPYMRSKIHAPMTSADLRIVRRVLPPPPPVPVKVTYTKMTPVTPPSAVVKLKR